MRASPISRKRLRGSLVKQRRNNPSTRAGVLDGSAVQSGSFIITAAMVSEAVSPENSIRPVSIS